LFFYKLLIATNYHTRNGCQALFYGKNANFFKIISPASSQTVGIGYTISEPAALPLFACGLIAVYTSRFSTPVLYVQMPEKSVANPVSLIIMPCQILRNEPQYRNKGAKTYGANHRV
jgi:hypothetical protein